VLTTLQYTKTQQDVTMNKDYFIYSSYVAVFYTYNNTSSY